MLGIKIHHKSAYYYLVIFYHLSLQNSMRGIQYEDYFDKLADSVYECVGLDIMCIHGDFNAKICNRKDWCKFG